MGNSQKIGASGGGEVTITRSAGDRARVKIKVKKSDGSEVEVEVDASELAKGIVTTVAGSLDPPPSR